MIYFPSLLGKPIWISRKLNRTLLSYYQSDYLMTLVINGKKLRKTIANKLSNFKRKKRTNKLS